MLKDLVHKIVGFISDTNWSPDTVVRRRTSELPFKVTGLAVRLKMYWH